MKADRAKGVLIVKQVWFEPGLQPTDARLSKLEAEIDRMARFVGMKSVHRE